jgi:hypothetical protein
MFRAIKPKTMPEALILKLDVESRLTYNVPAWHEREIPY